MDDAVLLSDLDLAALLCSRVCHDVISPVGAIANGLEVLEEETDAEMREIASELVAKSARQASAKLQFCRMAFGAAGSAGAMIDTGEAGDVAKMFLQEEKVTLDWQVPRENRAKQEVKLMLNMLLMAIATVPLGGTVVMNAQDGVIEAKASGKKARLPENMLAVINNSLDADSFDARLVQFYYAKRIAGDVNLELVLSIDNETTSIRAQPVMAARAIL